MDIFVKKKTVNINENIALSEMCFSLSHQPLRQSQNKLVTLCI